MNVFMRISCSSSSRSSGWDESSSSAGYLKAFRRRVVGSILGCIVVVAIRCEALKLWSFGA